MIQTHRHAIRKPQGVGIGQDYYNEQADATERTEYYASVQEVLERGDGDDVYQSLNGLLRSTHRDLSYKQARRHLYKTIDRRPDGALYYLYSGEGPKNEEEVDGPNRRRLSGYNCEHVVPQSWFHKRRPMKSDLHHLFTEATTIWPKWRVRTCPAAASWTIATTNSNPKQAKARWPERPCIFWYGIRDTSATATWKPAPRT